MNQWSQSRRSFACSDTPSNSRWWRSYRLILAVMALIAAVPLFAQVESRATVGGKVTDPAGAVIPNAEVVLTAQESGVKIPTKTGATGDWSVHYLNPGHYQIEITAPGFKKLVRPPLQLVVADNKVVDSQMEVGAATESIVISTTAPLIDVTAASGGTIVESSEIDEIPTNSNAPTQLVGLTPGAMTGSAVGGTGVWLWSNGGLSGASISGSGSGNLAINYTIDGAIDNETGGSVAFEPPSDAISQFRVITNAYDASIGRSAAGVVNLDMKGGATAFHGDLYENNYTNFLNARYYNTKTNSPVHNNQYGGSFGGPAWIPKIYDGRKQKTFFFYTFAGIRNRQPGSTGYMSLPTQAERNGDFSNSYQVVSGTTYAATIYDPLTYNSTTGKRTAFSSNQIPSARQSSFAKAIYALLPLPETTGDGANSDSNNYTKHEQQDDKFAGQTLRVDQNWKNNQHTYATLRWNNWTEISYDPFGESNTLNGIGQHRNNKGITIDHTLPLRENLLVDLRFSLTRWVGESYSTSRSADPSQEGLSSNFISQMYGKTMPYLVGIAIGAENDGLGTAQKGAYTGDNSYSLEASFVQPYRAHSFHYGASYIVQQQGNTTQGASGGSFNFGSKSSLWQVNSFVTQNPDASAGSGTGFAPAAFYLGLPQSGSIANTTRNLWSQHYTAFYFQDDWRVNSRFTLNLGLRWDYERPVTERNNAFFSHYDPTAVNDTVTSYAAASYASLFTTSSTNTGVQLIQNYGAAPGNFSAKGAIHYAGQNGTSRYVVNPRYIYFQPRIGFAYQLRPNLVIRGGAGRFVQPSFITGNQLGYSQTTTMSPTKDNYHTIYADITNPFPDGLNSAIGNTLGTNTDIGSVSSYYDMNYGRVYTDQTSLQVQKQYKDMLIEIGGNWNVTNNYGVYDPIDGISGYEVNNPSQAAYKAAFTPTFDSTGRPVDTLAGNKPVTNPFYGATYMINSTSTSKTISAYQLLRPNPTTGNIYEYLPKGKERYYALQTKLERRFHNGLSFINAFSWQKQMANTRFSGRQQLDHYMSKQIDNADRTFHESLSGVYELPVGKGKWLMPNSGRLMNLLVGGYEISGVYTVLSGVPVWMPTNTSFYKGGDPGKGFTKTRLKQFDTSKFAVFPSSSTPYADIHNTSKYPTWTGITSMTGASYVPTSTDSIKNGVYQDFATWNTHNAEYFGDVRYPRTNNLTFGVRKSFDLVYGAKLQLKLDMFNALNHPQFGSTDTTPGDTYFGALSGTNKPTQVNAPRQIQLAGRITF